MKQKKKKTPTEVIPSNTRAYRLLLLLPSLRTMPICHGDD